MNRLFQFLFNLHRAAWAAGGGWRLKWLSMPAHDWALALAVSAIAVVAMVWWVYRREGAQLPRRWRWVLVTLRLIALAGVLVMLLEPVVVFTKTDYVPSTVILLVDKSESMELHDSYADAREANAVVRALKLAGGATQLREQTRSQLADRALDDGVLSGLSFGGDRIIRRHDFGARLLPEAPPTTRPGGDAVDAVDTADRSATAIGVAIRDAISAYQGQPVSGILLVTDGQSNAGESPIKAGEFAGAEGVPVVSLAVGTALGPRSAKLGKIDVSPVVFIRDSSALHVQVESRGMAHQPAAVMLECSRDGGPWEQLGREPIVLEETGRSQTVTFNFKEDRPARLRMRATLEGGGPELQPGDHTATADVRAIRQKIRVLFIAGETFPEVEFIRAMLLRDTGISASTWLETADADYDQPGDPAIRRLPATAEELNEYDCIILYDPDPALWPENYSELLSDFVAKAGGGLIYVAGERNTKNLYDRPDDPSLAWLNILPVSVEPGLYHTDVTVKLSTESPWKLEITPEGRSDPIFQFADRPEENDTILSNLPGMYWYFPVTRARPGATVLARHGDPRMRNEYGQHVLLATQLVGPGRTFFVAFDSTYRWRYLDDRFFDSFWAHMVDRAGRSKQLGGRYPYTLTTDRTSYRPGSQVTLTARFDDPADRDAGLTAMYGEVQAGDDPPLPITLSPKQGDANAFEATFPASKAGPHFVRVWTGDQDARSVERAATLEIPVELPNLEMGNPTRDLATLQSVASASGGKVFDLTNASAIPDAFKTRRVARTLEDQQEIWNAPIIYITIVLAIIAEWIIRKRKQLV